MVDYGFYVSSYFGDSIPAGEFCGLAMRAQAQMDRYKRIYRVTTPEGSEKAEEKAVCAMADAMYYFDTAASGELSGSVSVGSVSTSRGQGTIPDLSQKAQERELYRCARLYLDIYRGADMLRVRKNPGLDYRLCDQTVTIYHQMGAGENFSCTRTVFRGAFLDFRKNQTLDKTGSRETNAFLLVLPSGVGGRPCWAAPDEYAGSPETFTLSPKDKVLLGEGPEITTREAWAAFLPAKTSGLVVIRDVDPKYFRGTVVHVEAGG